MILERLKRQFSTELIQAEARLGETVVIIKREKSHEILAWLRDDPELKFEFLIDLCGVDRFGLNELPRFAVVFELYSLILNHRLRLKVPVPEEDCRIASVTDLWKGADWLERECWEMFGIVFQGHPNLRHLLLFDGFEGFPLRKDYPIERRQKIPVPEETPA